MAPRKVERPAVSASLPIWIGVDIGGTKTAVALSSALPQVNARISFPTLPARGPDRAIALIESSIEAILASRAARGRDLKGIGVSCGGPLDRLRGVIQSPPNLPGWNDIPITEILSRRFGVRARLENDANAGAVAEYRHGAGRGCGSMVFFTMGTGFGAGIILDGLLVRGACELAGEIGHVRLTRRGPVGHGKSGSAEGWVSGGGVAQVAREAAETARKRGVRTALARILRARGEITARDVGVAARGGDLVARAVIRSTGQRLGRVLAIVVDILNPERIVIGGLALRMGDALLDPAREVIKREALATSARACKVVPAALGERIGDVAALCVAKGI